MMDKADDGVRLAPIGRQQRGVVEFVLDKQVKARGQAKAQVIA